MILHLRLIEMELLQFCDLQQLPERHEQAVLLDLAITQNYLPRPGEGILVSGGATGIEITFQPARDHSANTTGVRDDAVCLDITKFDTDRERRVLGLRQERKAAGYFAAGRVRGDLRKIELIRGVAERRLQLLEKKSITERRLFDAHVPAQVGCRSETRTKTDVVKSRNALQLLVQKAKAAVHQIDSLNLRRERDRLLGFERPGKVGLADRSHYRRRFRSGRPRVRS